MTRGENQESQTGNVPAASAAAPGPKPALAGGGKGAEGQSVVRRLQSELMALMMGGDPGVSAFPEGDNMLHWVGRRVPVQAAQGAVRHPLLPP
jgi:ubiquitin-conjugating enzyme E2 C